MNKIKDFLKNYWFFILAVLLFIISLGLYFGMFHDKLSDNSEKWDHFGSYIGGMFSALAFIAVVYSQYIDKKRFDEQKAELK